MPPKRPRGHRGGRRGHAGKEKDASLRRQEKQEQRQEKRKLAAKRKQVRAAIKAAAQTIKDHGSKLASEATEFLDEGLLDKNEYYLHLLAIDKWMAGRLYSLWELVGEEEIKIEEHERRFMDEKSKRQVKAELEKAGFDEKKIEAQVDQLKEEIENNPDTPKKKVNFGV